MKCSIMHYESSLFAKVLVQYKGLTLVMHAVYFCILHYSQICILFAWSTTVVSRQFLSEWKTVWILIRWLRWPHQKPADLDLQCFQRKIKLGSALQGLSFSISFTLACKVFLHDFCRLLIVFKILLFFFSK